MKTFTQEEVQELVYQIDEAYRLHTRQNILGDEIFNVFLKKKDPKKEEVFPFTAFYLLRKLTWEDFCELTGIDYYARAEGYEINDDALFYLTKKQIDKYEL